MKRIVFLLLLAASLLMFSTTAAQAIIMVNFSPTPVDVVVGTSFEVDIIANIPQAENVSTFGLEVLYDDALLSLDSYEVNRTLFPYNTRGAISSDVIEGLFGWFHHPSVYGDEVLLATLQFACLGEGTSLLDLGPHPDEYMDGEAFYTIDILNRYPMAWTYNQGVVNQVQAPVPEPATMLLLGSGLIGLAGFRRRFRKS